MTVEQLLAEGRAEAEALMVDACEVVRLSGGATDPDTGVWSENETPVYTGKCRVQVQDSLDPQSPDYGGGEVTTQRATVSIPISATGVQVGDRVTVTAATLDPDLEGVLYTVEAVHRKTHATARRLRCEEVTAGGAA